MKVLFVENRKKSLVWHCWSEFLKTKGVETAFVIYNHAFALDGDSNYIIPYPQKKDLVPFPKQYIDEDYNLIYSSDRLINHFGKNDLHYYFYLQKIKGILDEVAPDIVIGESTQFYELFIISECKKRNILYLNPSSCRYPTHRYSFYLYDTLIPYGGSNELIPTTEAISIIDGIVHRSVKPDYMSKLKMSRSMLISYWLYEMKVLRSRYQGAKYIIPSLFDKLKKDNEIKGLCKRWDAIANGKKNVDSNFIIMYPMQMQPEANLDVWGHQYMNQLTTIKKLVDKTQEDVIILVKPNPKAKYEFTKELLDYIENEDRVLSVPLSCTMQSCLNKSDMIVTVTGTIAIECILMNKPVLTLQHTLNNEMKNCPFLDDIKKITKYVRMVKERKFPKISEDDKIHFLNRLNATSYFGMPEVSDYDSDLTGAKECLDDLYSIVTDYERKNSKNTPR